MRRRDFLRIAGISAFLPSNWSGLLLGFKPGQTAVVREREGKRHVRVMVAAHRILPRSVVTYNKHFAAWYASTSVVTQAMAVSLTGAEQGRTFLAVTHGPCIVRTRSLADTMEFKEFLQGDVPVPPGHSGTHGEITVNRPKRQVINEEFGKMLDELVAEHEQRYAGLDVFPRDPAEESLKRRDAGS